MAIFMIEHGNAQNENIKNIVVDYNVFYNTEYPLVKKAKLIIDKEMSESIFLVFPNNLSKEKAELVEETKINLNFGNDLFLFNYRNKLNKKLYTKDHMLDKEYIIKEDVPTFKWELLSEEKIKDSIVLKKAKTVFRGREYIAWYSMDFPIDFGPWKFNGLPGLIFEISDKTNRYKWELTKINYDENKDYSKILVNETKSDTINIKQYVDLRYNKDLDLKFGSRLPRNIKIKSTKTNRPNRNDIEIKFEWEEKNEKQD